MVERSLSMREAPGSIPGLSIPALQVGGLYSSVGQSARLVSARSGVRTSLEAIFLGGSALGLSADQGFPGFFETNVTDQVTKTPPIPAHGRLCS